jgi:S-methylmethionine-dependent homocysteine/selenocysteine methylase
MTSDRRVMILDGATGTELDRRGVDISLPLWSARALISAPDVLAAVHRDYLDAGADAITANTFRTNRRTLALEPDAHGALDADELTIAAVRIARAVRDEHKPGALVLGSVAPLEDCYRPDLAPGPDDCAREHADLIETLVAAGVDRVLIETMNNLTETRAATDAARLLAPDRWMVSFCFDTTAPPGTLLGGEPVEAVLDELRDAAAVGVNCVAAPEVVRQVAFLRERLPEAISIIAYANIGYADDRGNWVPTDAVDPDRYAEYAASWVAAGASIVGGCCGTTPATIAAVTDRLR